MPSTNRLSFTDAKSHLATAEDALGGWYARQTTKTSCYVADGHVVITSIDHILLELHRVRAALIDEIRTDEDERAVRVDRILAESRARRAAQGSAGRVSDSAVEVQGERGGQ
jgi:hypothetical protein